MDVREKLIAIKKILAEENCERKNRTKCRAVRNLTNHVPFKNRSTGLMMGTKPNMGDRFP